MVGPASLRLATHNVNGLVGPGRAARAAALWRALRLDVVAVQETHLSLLTAARVDLAFRAHGFRAIWCHGHTSAGVALVVRQRLLASGELDLDEDAAQRPWPGRLLHVAAKWAGHKLRLASVYLPSGQHEAQRRAIKDYLVPLAQLPGDHLWGGDYNFVDRPALDRLRGAGAGDAGPAAAWRSELPALHDVFRRRHPARRAFTFVSSRTASRLDRFYAPAHMADSFVVRCEVASRVLGPGQVQAAAGAACALVSDHRPLVLHLLGRTPAAVGRGLPRVRLDFLADEAALARLEVWLAPKVASAPADDDGLLVWWPLFKAELAAECRSRQRAARDAAKAATLAEGVLASLYAGLDRGVQVSPLVVARAQRAAAEASAVVAAADRLRRRRDWVHAGERPAPALTRILAPPKDQRLVAGLLAPDGTLVSDPAAMPEVAASFWASVSAAPRPCPAAEAAVLSALASSPRVAPHDALALGDPEVSLEEVVRAVRGSPSGRSPGPDGLPSELYRKLGGVLRPLLSRLFSAIGRLADTPATFLDGAITMIHKAGPKAVVANYRPITLLNSDYRLLARVLAARLQRVLGEVIDPAQTAFLAGRRIGANLVLLQSLPHWLRQQRPAAGAVVVLCDFAKAYDTLSRAFLLRVMACLGVGPSFLGWTATLLRHTRACAVVNGYASKPVAFRAGVRQGCPLAPLLYLFAGQALLCWWRARGVGIPGPEGRPLTALQYADDAVALLPTVAALPGFLGDMTTFGDASGQRLQPPKVKLLLMGSAAPAPGAALPPPAATAGLPAVATALVLGMAVPADPPERSADGAAVWPSRRDQVLAAFGRAARFRLSAFGRGFASNAYGVSRLLDHAELSSLPPPEDLDALQRVTARLVDRNQGAGPGQPRAFAGVAGWLLPGSPVSGGFGCLPWLEHVCARHAWWAASFVCAAGPAADDPPPPWAATLADLLRGSVSSSFPRLPPSRVHPLMLFTCPGWAVDAPQRGHQATLNPLGCMHLPGPLSRLLRAARAMPRLVDVAERDSPLQPGDWCLAAPLWGNPLLLSGGVALEYTFGDVACLPGTLDTVGDVLWLLSLVSRQSGVTLPDAIYDAHFDPYLSFRVRYHAEARLSALLSALPARWLQAAQVALSWRPRDPRPRPAAAWRLLFPRLGWFWTVSRSSPSKGVTTLSGLAVREATWLLLSRPGGLHERRAERLVAYERAAGQPASAVLVLAAFDLLWRVRCENQWKEVFWRLVYDALPTAARLHASDPSCPCGAPLADRQHHFWACPVAVAVVREVAAAAAAVGRPLGGGGPLQQDVWLARVPDGVNAGVWAVVVLAVVVAMDRGRRVLVAHRLGGGPSGPGIVAVASQQALRQFWELLYAFAALGGLPPQAGGAPLDAAHPFLCLSGGRGVRVHRP